MLDRVLPFALVLLAFASWISTLLLVRAAWQRPRIGVLTERAVIAVVLALFGTACVVLVVNTESGEPFFTLEAARIVFRISLLILLTIPVYWLALYLTNRLGAR